MARRGMTIRIVGTGWARQGRQEACRAAARRGWIVPLMVALLLVSTGAGLVHPRGASGRTPTLAVIGDSMSAGYRLAHPRTQSWPAILVHKYPQLGKLVDLAIPGYGFFNEGKVRNGPEFRPASQTMRVIAARPTLIVIWMGINDFHHGYTVADVTQHLDQMLSALAVTGAPIFVINYMDARAMDTRVWNAPIEQNALAFNHTMLPVLARHHATLIDMYHQTQAIWGNPMDIQLHGAPHPTVQGTTAIAQVVATALYRAGLL